MEDIRAQAGWGGCHWEPPSSSLGGMTRPYSFNDLPTPHVSITQGTADVGRQHVNPAIKVKVGGDVTWPTPQARMGRKWHISPLTLLPRTHDANLFWGNIGQAHIEELLRTCLQPSEAAS